MSLFHYSQVPKTEEAKIAEAGSHDAKLGEKRFRKSTKINYTLHTVTAVKTLLKSLIDECVLHPNPKRVNTFFVCEDAEYIHVQWSASF